MKSIVKLAQILILILLPNVLLAQQDQRTLVDIFYEILISEEDFSNAEREPIYVPSGKISISPEEIISKYPDAKEYLVDSLLVYPNEIDIKFQFEDVNISFRNLCFKEPVRISSILKTGKSNLYSSSEVFIGRCVFDSLLFEDYESPDLIVINESKILSLVGYFDYFDRGSLFQLFKNSIDQLSIYDGNFHTILISHNTIKSMVVCSTEAENLSISGNKIISRHKQFTSSDSLTYNLRGSQSKFSFRNDSSTFLNQSSDYTNFYISFDSYFDDVNISGNIFESDAFMPVTVYDANSLALNISNNVFESTFLMSGKTENEFLLRNNDFMNGISLYSFGIPETPMENVDINWEDLSGNLKVVFGENRIGARFVHYNGRNDLELTNLSNFDFLIKSYAKIYKGYRDNGSLTKSNKCYYEMKTVYLRLLEYNYKNEGGISNFFKLKLGQLLKVYTKHGTDPSQAVSASFWIILLFGIIYFFFPSEWDSSSKAQLVSNFRDFTQKNDKGYIKPFLIMLGGLLLSLLNALTLSINSFVTLGFGKIPTRGAAKYLCIIQGFMGWFLLGVFMVALINQVLF